MTHWPQKQSSFSDLTSIRQFFSTDIDVPLATDLQTKDLIRNLLRHGGFSPSGRNKPSWEYLEKAIQKGWFSPEKGINAAVDCCNVTSLHAKIPVSVLDLDKCVPPYCVQICPPQTTYPFNPSGQLLKADGLIALFDAEGPCGTPVKDAQRTKTDPDTLKTLSLLWGHVELSHHINRTCGWYRSLLTDLGCQTTDVNVVVNIDL
ncbi:MAG: hypothetical protein CMK59_15615 [Proteobacteria bacterium]|nr:hypothetical protein [Pseudomonadota bacterium]